MEKAITNLGTKELHDRHSIMIEGGQFPRSRVMDQCIFDRYLMLGEINLTQHKAAESLLNMAAKANVWAKGANMNGTYVDGVKGAKVPFGMVPFGNALYRIRLECGVACLEATKAVIIRNKDVRKLDKGIEVFKVSMDFVNDNLIHFHNPLRHLK